MKIKRIISAAVLISLLILVLAVSATPASAAYFDGDSLAKYGVNQFYARGMSATATILSKMSEATGNETIKDCTSFINKWLLGSSDQGEKLSAIQATCNEILSTTTDVKNITTDIQSLQNAEIIKSAAQNVETAWYNQVEVIIKNNDLNNLFEKYTDYLAYSSDYKSLPQGKTIEDFHQIYLSTLRDVCAKHCSFKYTNADGDRNKYYDNVMYTTDTLDVLFCDGVEDLLDCMENKELYGDRFIDKAALYAYYAFPFSSEQADFVDNAAGRQFNKITVLLMMYQDFLAQRACYYTSLNEQGAEGYETEEQCNKYFKTYSCKYTDLLTEFSEDSEEFFDSDIVLNDGHIYAKTKLDMYLRNDSASVKSTGNNTFTLKCNTNYDSAITQTPAFYKNASVKAENGELVFTPFYVLNGDVLSDEATKMKSFNTSTTKVTPSFFGQSVCHTEYSLTNNYKCLKNGAYSDGNNSYKAISNAEELKKIVNSTAYSAYKYTPYTYFGDYLSYLKNDTPYLFLSSNADYCNTNPYNSFYSLPFFNLKNEKGYSEEWSCEKISQLDMKNQKFAVILTPQSSSLKTTVDSQVKGCGTVKIDDATSGAFDSGSSVNLKIEADNGYVITSVKALYHGDVANPSKVTCEKILSSEENVSSLEFDFGVPYTNVTISVETQKALPVDENGSYIISSFSDLALMAEMIESGNSGFLNCSYTLESDIICPQFEAVSIGAEKAFFNGHFNGNGHTIMSMGAGFYLDEQERQHLFNIIGENAVVENLRISGALVESSSSSLSDAGIICAENRGVIKGCIIENSEITLSEEGFLGGFAGVNNGTIENCGIENTVIRRSSQSLSMGGIAQVNNGVIKNTFSYNCTFENGDSSQNSPILSAGNAPENSYFFTESQVNRTYGAEKTLGSFERGEVTYLLNCGVTDGTQTFYQYIGVHFSPVISSDSYAKTVYKTSENTYSNNP